MSAKAVPIRVVAANDGYQEDALQLALAYVGAVLKSRPNLNPDIVLLTHSKQQLSATSLASMLGQQAAKALAAGKLVNSPVGSIRHATLRTMGYPALSEPSAVCAAQAMIKMGSVIRETQSLIRASLVMRNEGRALS